MSTSDYTYSTAAELIAAMNDRAISAVELADAAIEPGVAPGEVQHQERRRSSPSPVVVGLGFWYQVNLISALRVAIDTVFC